jgi:hypothetical protein
MASEMRRMAKLLVSRRSEAFESRYPRAESEARVNRALEGFSAKGMVFETAWREEAGSPVLDVSFAPSRGTRFFLNSASAVFTMLLLASLWALLAPGEMAANGVMVTIFTLAAILAFPFVVLAYASRREAEESTLRKKIRKAIVEVEEKAR